MGFTLSDNVNNDKVLLTSFSNATTKRWDPNYQHLFKKFLKTISRSPFPIERLKESIIYLQYGTSKCATEEPLGTPVLRMANMQEEVWDLTKLKYLEVSPEEKKSYLLEKGDLLFNRTNSKELVGKCNEFNLDEEYIFASYLIRVRLDTRKLLPQYVTAFLSSNLGRLQIDAVSRQIAGMTNINAEEIQDFLIPVPSIATQQLIVDMMSTAFHQKQQKEKEARELILSIDDYFLDELGVVISEEKRASGTARIFARQFSDITESRLDPHYHQPKYQNLVDAIPDRCKTTIAKEATLIFSGMTPKSGGDAYTDKGDGVAFIRSGDFSENGSIRYQKLLFIKEDIHLNFMAHSAIKSGDVLFAIVGATIGKVGVYRETYEANINQAICAVRLEERVIPEYLQGFFMSRLGQMLIDQAKRPVARANLNLDEISKLPFYLPEMKVQEKIVKKIKEIYKLNMEIKKEAANILIREKLKVEQIILGID